MFPLHPPRVPSAYPPPYTSIDKPPTPPKDPFTPSPSLILKTAPPLDPAWLAHESTLPTPPPAPTDALTRQKTYAQTCRTLNAHLLSGIYADLNHGIKIHDSLIETGVDSDNLFPLLGPGVRRMRIPIRSYNLSSSPSGPPPVRRDGRNEEEGSDIVVYYHGGGLYVGDLDSEDLTCRRLCKELSCTVYSVGYRLMPEHSADDAVSDAFEAFRWITSTRKAKKLVVMGSSSGGQLAGMVAAKYRVWRGPMASMGSEVRIHGVCLRGPVLCDATDIDSHLPAKLRDFHTSMSVSFHTSLLSGAALNADNRTTSKLPLEEDAFEGLPRHWIQVCTNDVYYSDGVLYGECLREAGTEVKMDVVEGWPHTFWLKAPELERAIQAERACVEGVRWLFESEIGEDGVDVRKNNGGEEGGFVPFSDMEFERYAAIEDAKSASE